jgi:BirA family biotin operon repressor/biotin-[acetyl-CoA-carboxylase] ligase
MSEAGKNLTFSLLIKPTFLSVQDQFFLNQTFSLGLLDYLKTIIHAEVKIKWPNDVLVNNKKICGILIENHISGQHIQNSIVGIGLNVNQDIFSIPRVTSMAIENNKKFSLEEVLPVLLECLETRYLQLRTGKFDELSRKYADSMYWMGEMHLFKKKEELFEGVITGIDLLGRLKIQIDGTTEYFEVKEVQFLK